jgi:hypothetical protein
MPPRFLENAMPIPVPAIDYRTLHAPDLADLDHQVYMALAEGWSLWGNPYTMNHANAMQQYCQAMVLLPEDA